MNDYIRGLKTEAEQIISDIEEMKEQGRKVLDDIDRQIFKLMHMKEEHKSKADRKLKALKDQAEEKMKMYNKVAGVRTGLQLPLLSLQKLSLTHIDCI